MNSTIISSKTMILTKDIINPWADKRNKYQWQKQEAFPKGMRFIIRVFDLGERYNIDEVRGKTGREITRAGGYGEAFPDTPNNYELWCALEPYLEHAPITIQSILEDEGEDNDKNSLHYKIFDYLLSEKKLNRRN